MKLYSFMVGLVFPGMLLEIAPANSMDWLVLMNSVLLLIVSVISGTTVSVLTLWIKEKFYPGKK